MLVVRTFGRTAGIGLAALGLNPNAVYASGDVVLPAGFELCTVASGMDKTAALAFAPDGRLFIAQQNGLVRILEDDMLLPDPFIDLTEEVNGQHHHGLIGIALDPDFMDNHHVYLMYTLDPIFGEPDESPEDGSWGRLVRYTGTVENNGNIADLDSRLVLLGTDPSDGVPICHRSHGTGALRFALDGTLFVACGEGAHFEVVDPGGLDPECFVKGMFSEDQDIGAFRSQYLDTLAGKILRIDPATGEGVSTNPYWTGNGQDLRSRVWVYGVRNPFRFAIQPDSGKPGVLFVSDVGWNDFEELLIAEGGENFGWPCFEGFESVLQYQNQEPAHHGCDTLETPDNPGPLTEPLISWHHSEPDLSVPPGISGHVASGCLFYTADSFPAEYHGAFFFSDYTSGWINILEVDENNEFVAIHEFAAGLNTPADLALHPITGDLYIASRNEDDVKRITFTGAITGDLDGDGMVGASDLILLLGAWGRCADCDNCVADLDGDCTVGTPDLLILLGHWG